VPRSRILVLLAVCSLLVGCTSDGDEDPAAKTAPPASEPVPKALLPVADQADGVDIGGCVNNHHPVVDTALVWIQLHATERVRLASVTTREHSNGLSAMRAYLAPDPGPEAPSLADSVGRVPGPRAIDVPEQDVIGDLRDTRSGRAAAARAWEQRRELPGALTPGDHYVFVQLGLTNRVNVHDLLLNWSTTDGELGESLLRGTLFFRGVCGG
jgi:hypothetical protein